ncbi:hypothetical protein K503DRAFT_850391 [Rhizopogon vinicolor AM-OR11-026]|uniref:Uncharacterized protein n=1 Tax=Rhizopogon vinicolor AM-OR11-026 TaxID=1314800 RepID=A0A1B7MYB2_9AGAM|nr:hypothetical protein K503DRAFT_850391 [Rhizopogon vinicolor AM-OR11-026]
MSVIGSVIFLDTRDRKGENKVLELKHGEILIHLAEDVQRRLDCMIQSNESLQMSMSKHDLHVHLTTTSFVLSGVLPRPALAYENITADRDMSEIEMLEQTGAIAAGKLPAQQEDNRFTASLEKRIAALVERHVTHVRIRHSIFIVNVVFSETENKVAKLERDRGERQRLGHE